MKHDRLTKAELIRRINVLQEQVEVGGLHDLRAHDEELRTQNEQLVDIQHSLEESRDRYVDLFDFAPVGYTTLSSVGAIEEANLTLARMLGVERRLLIRRSFRTFVVESDRHAFLDHLSDCGHGETTHTVELHLLSEGGAVVPVRLTTRGMSSRSLWTAVTDLTAYARLDAERRRIELRAAEVRAASDAKDRFLAILSHELRTPLTPILAAVSSFADIADTPPELRSILEIVRRNVVTETRLIDDLLDVTRIEQSKLSLEIGPVDLHDMVRETARERSSPAGGPGQEIVLDLQAASHHVAADRTRLRQVLWNLLGNARRHGQGGAITVRTRNDAAGWVRFTIEDHGIGIEPELLSRIFIPFTQGERRRPGARGLGLGLAICKGIVLAHGGEISVRSPGAGRGTTVEVRWKTTTAMPVVLPQPPPVVALDRRLRILLVEDDADSAIALALLLRLDRHDVVVATTCKEAVEKSDPPPDLIISDLDLPDGSGLDLLRTLRRTLECPALALSGHGSGDDIRQSRQAGFQEHLVKPVERSTLVAAIARVTLKREGAEVAHAGAKG